MIFLKKSHLADDQHEETSLDNRWLLLKKTSTVTPRQGETAGSADNSKLVRTSQPGNVSTSVKHHNGYCPCAWTTWNWEVDQEVVYFVESQQPK